MPSHTKKYRVFSTASAKYVNRKVNEFLYRRALASLEGERLSLDLEEDLNALRAYLKDEDEPDWRSVARALERLARKARKLELTQTELEVKVEEGQKTPQALTDGSDREG